MLRFLKDIVASITGNAIFEFIVQNWQNVLTVVILPVILVLIRFGRSIYVRNRQSDEPKESTNDVSEDSVLTESPIEDLDCWRIDEDRIRDTKLMYGEGSRVFIGFAKVNAEGDGEYPELYLCAILNLDNGQTTLDFRIPFSSYGLVLETRHCVAKLVPGEIPVYERNWTIEDKPSSSILFTENDILEDAVDLIESSSHLVLIWTDTYKDGLEETSNVRKRRISVTTKKLVEVSCRLHLLGFNLRSSGLFL